MEKERKKENKRKTTLKNRESKREKSKTEKQGNPEKKEEENTKKSEHRMKRGFGCTQGDDSAQTMVVDTSYSTTCIVV